MRKLFFPPEKQEKAWETESPRALEVALIDYGNPLFTEKYLFQWLLPLHRTIQAGLYTEEAFPIKNYKAQFKAIYFLQSYTHSGVGEFEGHTYKEYRKILFNQFSQFFIKSLNISTPSTSYLKEIQRTWFEVGKEFENKEAIKYLEKLNN